MGLPGGVTVRCRTLQPVALAGPDVTTVRLIVKKKLAKEIPSTIRFKVGRTHRPLTGEFVPH